MQTKLATAVAELFSTEMTRRLPTFVLRKGEKVGGTPLPLFEFRTASSMAFFVLLTFAQKRDAFTVEVAFNESPQFPWTELPGTVKEVSSAASRRVARFRLAKLWGETRDVWWALGKELSVTEIEEQIKTKSYLRAEDLPSKLEAVPIAVADAIEKLVTYGVPFFELVKQHKINPPTEVGRKPDPTSGAADD